ncbi:MAG: hypothetical protein ACREEM_22145 [Blastocatellia bacterium]
MAVCPSCKSSRIRNDYKPAPVWLRLLGIRALLCDHCNHQFRAFSLRPPKSGRPRHALRETDLVKAAVEVDLAELRQKVAEAQSEKSEAVNWIKLSLNPTQTGEVVAGQALPVRKDIQTQVLKLHAQGAAAESERAKKPSPAAETMPQCSECNSRNVRRRRRTTIERATLRLANLKAFNCKDCGASFYARPSESENKPDRDLFDSTTLRAEHEG